MVSSYTLLTGVTGQLGQYLMRDLLMQGHRLAVVVRPSRRQSIVQRVEEILQFWESETGTLLPRPVVLEGDICESSLGLNPASRQWVAEHCSSVLHNAASLTFHKDAWGEPHRSNVGGVDNMLRFCQATDISEFHYVSTAYVAGVRQGIVKEDDLQAGQVFRNDYEHSKFEAELRVRAADCIDRLTVYRPAVIAGDSRTGYTSTYHGLHMYLKLMSVLVRNTEPDPDGVRNTPVRFDMTGDEERNIVPVDWVSAVICHLFATPDAHGRTYHLAPETPLTPRQIIEAGYRYYNTRGVQFFAGPAASRPPISEIDRNAHENMSMYREYDVCDPKFDLTNLRDHASHLPCPVIDEPMLHRFLRYGEEDRWGKRRKKKPTSYENIENHCSRLVVECSSGIAGEAYAINLRVLGPGGGDWKLQLSDGEIVEFDRGGFKNADAEFQIESVRFWWLTESQQDFPWADVEKNFKSCPSVKEEILVQLCEVLFGVLGSQRGSSNVRESLASELG